MKECGKHSTARNRGPDILAETAIDPSLRYFRDRLRIPWVYLVVNEGSRDVVDRGVRCVPAATFLAALA